MILIDRTSRLSKNQISRLKNVIRFCDFGKFTIEESMKRINSGVLGYHKTTKNGTLIPITISERTYYRYRNQTQDLNEVEKELRDFMREEYTIQMHSILSVIRELFALTQQNLHQAKTARDRQYIINSMIQNFPKYTQYLEVIRILMERGKLPLGESSKEIKHDVS
ncbi:MAG: hypothetical protein ACT4N5_05690 [Nitrosopumilaceae archaeon]